MGRRRQRGAGLQGHGREGNRRENPVGDGNDRDDRDDGRDRTNSTTDGALVLGNLPNNGDVGGSTKEFTITTNELDGDYYWTDGSKDKLEEKIEGIYVKVFHRGQNVLEYRSGNSDVKTANWTDEQALGLKAEKNQ